MDPLSALFTLLFVIAIRMVFPPESGSVNRMRLIALTALLLAVFPANVHMAVDQGQIERMAKAGIPRWALYARLPLQPV